MKTKVIITFLVILTLCGANPVQAATVWIITEDTDIYSGFYDFINIYDTPPDHTTVNMYGGGSDYITTYDESTLNFFGDSAQIGACDNSIVKITGGILNGVEAYNYGTINFSGSSYTDHLIASDFGTIDITGALLSELVP